MEPELPADVPLAALVRGGLTESVHRGRYAVCDADGAEVRAGGDAGFPVWVRSSAKPFQALPLAASGAAEALGLTDDEIAVACGSHSGEQAHLEAVRSMLDKAGLSEDDLQSGAHPPMYAPAAAELARVGQKPRQIHGNCSGKHAGMLALCAYRGWETRSYRDPGHPVQRLILEAVRGMCGVGESEVRLGGDGCGAPAFALPLPALAVGFARLASGIYVPGEFREAAERVRRAMREHPFMVAGSGRFDTRLMQESRVICKGGAEGVFAAGTEDGFGVAIKVSDGAGRAVEPAALPLLDVPGERFPGNAVTDLHGVEVGSLESLV